MPLERRSVKRVGAVLGCLAVVGCSSSTSPEPVSSITVSPDHPEVQVGSSIQLTATPRGSGGQELTDRRVEWETSNASVATVDADGVVRGVAPGEATITARVEGASGSTPASVYGPPEVRTGEVVEVTTEGGVMEATVNPNGSTAHWHFEVGLTRSLGQRCDATDASVDGLEPQTVSCALAGHTPGRTLHYRIVARNRAGRRQGEVRTFTTEAVEAEGTPPEIVSVDFPGEVASAPGGRTWGTVEFWDPDGDVVMAHFQAAATTGSSFNDFAFDPGVEGEVEGSFEFWVGCLGPEPCNGTTTLDILLEDSEGSFSEPYRLEFTYVSPATDGPLAAGEGGGGRAPVR